jgi:hypothetical protein
MLEIPRFAWEFYRTFRLWLKSYDVRVLSAACVSCACEPEALPILAQQLRAFGARVSFEDQWAGLVMAESGTLFFRYEDHRLHVAIVEDHGHFPKALIIGGIKQTVEEANEIIRRAHAATRSLETAQESANS